MAFSKLLIEEAGVAVARASRFRRARRGLCAHRPVLENEHRIRQAARNVKELLDQSGQMLSKVRAPPRRRKQAGVRRARRTRPHASPIRGVAGSDKTA